MTLIVAVRKNGELVCYVPEHKYLYHVQSWDSFFAATGTNHINDYSRIVVCTLHPMFQS